MRWMPSTSLYASPEATGGLDTLRHGVTECCNLEAKLKLTSMPLFLQIKKKKKKNEIPSSCILPFHKPSVDLALLVHQHWWVKMGQELSAHRTAWRLRSYVGGLSLLFCSRTLVHNTFNKILTTGSKVFELLLGFLFYFSFGQLLVHFMWNAVLTEITGNFDTNIKGSKCHNLTTAHKEAKSLASEIHSETISANAGLRLCFALESYCVPTELFYSKFSGAAIPNMF